jgi:hypothetical protein
MTARLRAARELARVAVVLAPLAPAHAQERFATAVVDLVQGGGSGIFQPANLLGGPQGGGLGAGSIHVHSLGTGGSVTLGFDVVIQDGPGADLTVFENPLMAGGGSFSEVASIEVSSDGLTFVRFPSRYAGPSGPLPAFGSVPLGTYLGLTGNVPVVANVVTNAVDPFDPAVSGGESFDLAELADAPEVLAGLVDLSAIRLVRLVDVEEGLVLDSEGTPIWDNGGPGSSADIDAVAVLQHAGGVSPATQPLADLFLDDLGFLHVVLGDPQGLFDLDFSTLRVSFSLVQVPFTVLFSAAFAFVSFDGSTLHLVSSVPIGGTGLQSVMGISVRDLGGELSGDQAPLQG